MWLHQAEKACGGAPVTPVNVLVTLDDSKVAPLMVTETFGYAVCSGADLSAQEIQDAIREKKISDVKNPLYYN